MSPTPAAVTRRVRTVPATPHHSIFLVSTKNAGYVCKATAEETLGNYVDALKTLQAGQHIAPGKLDCAGRVPTAHKRTNQRTNS